MRIAITGEAGFVGRNLPASIKSLDHTFVPLLNHERMVCLPTGEPCVHQNNSELWAEVLKEEEVDVIIHNAAVVGTDVVALNPNEASLTNVAGTHIICQAAKSANIAVSYMGTSVIYETAAYQHQMIYESSARLPTTLYGAQKLAAEHVVMGSKVTFNIIRPLFAYGGVGDMNSLISKTLYSAKSGRQNIDMFLNPAKIKDYMHVTDYCDAVALSIHKGMWGTDYNVSAENPYNTAEIAEMIADISGKNLDSIINWHPETDYLGNHRLSSKKFRDETNWSPKFSLESGIKNAWESISEDESGYDPLIYLDEASERGLDLTQFY